MWKYELKGNFYSVVRCNSQVYKIIALARSRGGEELEPVGKQLDVFVVYAVYILVPSVEYGPFSTSMEDDLDPLRLRFWIYAHIASDGFARCVISASIYGV